MNTTNIISTAITTITNTGIVGGIFMMICFMMFIIERENYESR